MKGGEEGPEFGISHDLLFFHFHFFFRGFLVLPMSKVPWVGTLGKG